MSRSSCMRPSRPSKTGHAEASFQASRLASAGSSSDRTSKWRWSGGSRTIGQTQLAVRHSSGHWNRKSIRIFRNVHLYDVSSGKERELAVAGLVVSSVGFVLTFIGVGFATYQARSAKDLARR